MFLCANIVVIELIYMPTAAGRVWYEADINYSAEFPETERALFSNDGLVFVTYDQYLTFQEIV